MPNWNEVLAEIEEEHQLPPADRVRKRYLAELAEHTGRPTIAYYSGWQSGGGGNPIAYSISDQDKNAFMSLVHEMDRSKGLDLILHTPGGDLAAAESLVNYIRKMFGRNVRAIVPQTAMSAGTMIACSSRCIIMGDQSNIGPTDPLVHGLSADGVIKEFRKAVNEIRQDPAAQAAWQPIIGKYHPSFLEECERTISWASQLVKSWLHTGMFEGESAEGTINNIADGLSDPENTLSHSRHIHVDDAENMGLKIERMEDQDELQDKILTTHHAFMHTLGDNRITKIVENHHGTASVFRQAAAG